MKNKNIPANTELPSMKRLIKSTILAICIAAIILVSVVLPAEYGIDPTGVGSLIGLVKMGEIKVSLANEAAADRVIGGVLKSVMSDDSRPTPEPVSKAVSPETAQADANLRSDNLTISLSPDEGKEIKLTMNKGAQVNYVWWTDGGRANFDAHADSKKLQINYHSYGKGSQERSDGVMEAAFDGQHGWFWRNRTSEVMTVTLKVDGDYSDIKQVN